MFSEAFKKRARRSQKQIPMMNKYYYETHSGKYKKNWRHMKKFNLRVI
jgi:hypothetical protein